MNEKDAKRVVELYEKLEECKEAFAKMNVANTFIICTRDAAWGGVPLDTIVAKGCINNYFSKELAGITAQLKEFGFIVEGEEKKEETYSLQDLRGKAVVMPQNRFVEHTEKDKAYTAIIYAGMGIDELSKAVEKYGVSSVRSLIDSAFACKILTAAEAVELQLKINELIVRMEEVLDKTLQELSHES